MVEAVARCVEENFGLRDHPQACLGTLAKVAAGATYCNIHDLRSLKGLGFGVWGLGFQALSSDYAEASTA